MRFLFLLGIFSILLSACTVKIKTSIKEGVEEPAVLVSHETVEKKIATMQPKKVEKKQVSIYQEDKQTLVLQKGTKKPATSKAQEKAKESEVYAPSKEAKVNGAFVLHEKDKDSKVLSPYSDTENRPRASTFHEEKLPIEDK